MTPLTMLAGLMALPLAVDASWLSTRALGEAALISVGAIVLGLVVARLWPKSFNPQLFGLLAAISLIGLLAYWGSTGAGIALIVVVLLGALALFAGVAW